MHFADAAAGAKSIQATIAKEVATAVITGCWVLSSGEPCGVAHAGDTSSGQSSPPDSAGESSGSSSAPSESGGPGAGTTDPASNGADGAGPGGGGVWSEDLGDLPVPGSRLPNGDIAVGMDFLRNSNQCRNCGSLINGAYIVTEAAAVGTVVAVAAPLTIAEFGAGGVGDFLFHEARFNAATNTAPSGFLNSLRLARYGWGWYQYGITYQATASSVPAIAGMYVLRGTIFGMHFPYPF